MSVCTGTQKEVARRVLYHSRFLRCNPCHFSQGFFFISPELESFIQIHLAFHSPGAQELADVVPTGGVCALSGSWVADVPEGICAVFLPVPGPE